MNIPKPQSKQPIPDHAKKVFEGVIFDIYQWDQPMYDGSVRTFEKAKRPDTVIVFPVLDDGRIILTKQTQPGFPQAVWGGAGGAVDPGETILEAAHRELLEETGYVSEELIHWRSIQLLVKTEWVVYFFIARNLRKVADLNLDGGERIDLEYVTFDEFLEIASDPDFYEFEIIPDALRARLFSEEKENMHKIFYGENH